MKKAFVSALRLLAQLAREPVSSDIPGAIKRSDALRETIHANFDKVRSLADGVLFEFGPSRQQDLALRDHIRQWQPQLRTLFLMRFASLRYRLQLPGFELPEAVRLSLEAYDDRSAQMLEAIADRIEGNVRQPGGPSRESFEQLEQTAHGFREGQPQQLPGFRVQSFLALLRGIDGLTTSLVEEISTAADRSR
jgi:multidrug resistance protein MdtO